MLVCSRFYSHCSQFCSHFAQILLAFLLSENQERNKAEAALKKAETLLSEMRTNKFKLAAYRDKSDRLVEKVQVLKAEGEAVDESQWSFVDLEKMLTEALDERGPDDQTLEQTFMLLGEDGTKRLHLRMKRAYPTVFKERVKYKFIVINGRNEGEGDRSIAKSASVIVPERLLSEKRVTMNDMATTMSTKPR